MVNTAPVIPGPDKFSCQIKSSRQIIGGKYRTVIRFIILIHPVIGHRGRKPLKAIVMIESTCVHQHGIQLLLRPACSILIQLFLCQGIHLPHDAAPETIGPPADSIRPGTIIKNAVFCRVRNLIFITFRYRKHLFLYFFDCLFNP